MNTCPLVPLFELCRPKQYKTISGPQLTVSGYPVYGANGKIGFYSEYTHPDPTLMITCRGATCGNVHISDPKSYINGNAMALDQMSDRVYLRYLYFFFKSRGFDDVISGSAQPQITRQGLCKVKIPLPPFAEQKRIAAILDKADALRRKRQQAIDLADQFLRSVFLEMFGDPVTNPKGVETLPMTDVFHIKTGKLNSNAAVEGGAYPFFTCAKEVYQIDNYAFDQEALLLAGNNAQAEYDVKHYIGKFNAYQRTYVLSLKNERWSYPFFKFALEYQLENLKRSSKGSNTKYITMEIMSRTMLPVPNIDDQRKFVTYFRQQITMRKRLIKSLQESFNLFGSISQNAFRGDL